MQALYAFKQAEKSNYLLALDRIAETFSPDLNSMQVQDIQKLEGNRQLATILFEENYLNTNAAITDENASPEVLVSAANAINFYHQQVKKDRQLSGKSMLSEVEKIYDHYLLILMLLVELADLVKNEEESRQQKYLKAYTIFPGDVKLYNNPIICALREYKPLETELFNLGLSWASEGSLLRNVYNTVLKNDPVYLEYIQTAESSPEEDKKIVNHILKNLVFKQELLRNYFEEVDLNWTENGEIIRSLLAKTIKSIDQEGETVSAIELLTLSKNWEDDRDFFLELHQHTLDNDQTYEKLIIDKVQNWDAERVAVIDKILLKMAISEMVTFSSIPVKVTINEYIELSKLYSTPKSRQFINGVLDVVAIELVNRGIIRKSGRGLIDNK
ncbi:MAG: transcription antitermination factor NusB [Bacteroidota bacterium]